MNNILIVGANFNNKGAQSMLFVAVDEIYRRNPNARIYFGGIERWKSGKYTFDQVYYRDYNKAIAMNEFSHPWYITKSICKDIVKAVACKGNGIRELTALKKLMPSIDLVIDISGYNIGDKWNAETHENYFDNIRLAIKYHIPMILMPQSFGPFNYKANYKYLIEEAEELLSYPRIIFAREKKSIEYLQQKFNLSNIRLSSDMVLQNKTISIKNILLTPSKIETPIIKINSVGIIPNSKTVSDENRSQIFKLYQTVIQMLLSNGKRIYILKHSLNDGPLCSQIYSSFSDVQEVSYLNSNFSCLEYNEIVKQFDFIICSRYHGAVNAYKNGIPSVLLGWADKYDELAECLNQQKYCLNIRDSIDQNMVIYVVELMLHNYLYESSIIREKLKQIQSKNCFDEIDEYLH